MKAKKSIVVGWLALSVLVLPGCYTHDSLVERVRSKAIRLRIEEVDLGEFRVTLPRDERTSELTEIELRVFGESPRYKINEITTEIEEKRYLINDLAITVLRESSHSDLTEPNLDSLRSRLLEVFNNALTDAPLEAIGFHDVRFMRH